MEAHTTARAIQVFQILVTRNDEFMVARIEPPAKEQTPENMAQAIPVAMVWAPIFVRSEGVRDAFEKLVEAIGREVMQGAFGVDDEDCIEFERHNLQ